MNGARSGINESGCREKAFGDEMSRPAHSLYERHSAHLQGTNQMFRLPNAIWYVRAVRSNHASSRKERQRWSLMKKHGQLRSNCRQKAASSECSIRRVPANHISIVAKDLQEKQRVTGYVTADEVTKELASTGAWAGELFGLLDGAAFLFLPVSGPLIVLGPLVSAAVGALQGGVVGGLVGAILGSAMEREKVLKYERFVESGKVLVIVEGTTEELDTARRVMGENAGQAIETVEPAAA